MKQYMKQQLKDFLKKLPFYPFLRSWFISKRHVREFFEWEKNGRPDPPPHIFKQQLIKDIAAQYGLKVFVETGTYYGDMVNAVKNHFSKIYSIELSKEIFERAKKRFRGDEKIQIIHGDSGIVLCNLVSIIDQPTLFFLDGHYSAGETVRGEKDTPIYEELKYIFNGRLSNYVIIIDDARCFGSDPAYPRIEELTDFIKIKNRNTIIEVKNDCIRIIPRHNSTTI